MFNTVTGYVKAVPMMFIFVLAGCNSLLVPGGPSEDVASKPAWEIGFQAAEAWVLSEGLVDERYRKGTEGAYTALKAVTDGKIEWDREKVLEELDGLLTEEGWNEYQRRAARRYASSLVYRMKTYLEGDELSMNVLDSLRTGADDALRMYGVIGEDQ